MTIKSLEIKWRKKGLSVFVFENDNRISLNEVVVPKEQRGQGLGTLFMRDLCQYADKVGKPIVLTPDTTFGGTSKNRLIDFYKKFGFTLNKGKHKDWRFTELMIRRSKVVGMNLKIGQTVILASHMDIAKTIKSQINFRELMALGASKFIAMPESGKHLGGLRFNVSLFGKKPCTVTIMLNGKDLYDIEIKSNLGSKKVIYKHEDIYNDQLTDIIVNEVEKHFGSDYRR